MHYVTDLRSDSGVTVSKDEDALEQFDRVLVESGDLARLKPEAVSLLLAVRHYLRTCEDGQGDCFPDSETLQELTALEPEQVESGLDSLYRCGYLDKEPRRGDKNAAPGYRLREKSIWYDGEGEVAGEVSWDLPVSPTGLVGLPEFRNILMSDRLGGAKVVHIERLQVNLSGARDGGISVNALTSGDEDSSATQMQLIRLLEQVSKQWAGSSRDAEAQTPEPLTPPQPAASEELPPQPAAQAETDTAPESVPAAVSPAVEQTQAVAPKAAQEDVSPAEPDEGMADMAEFEKLYHQYVDRVHGEFVSALKGAEDAADEAYRSLVEQQMSKPSRPIGLGALIRGNRWQQQYEGWKKKQEQLQSAYDMSVKERQRLVDAMMPARNGEQPLYVREALEQLRQDYPALWARTEQARKSWF